MEMRLFRLMPSKAEKEAERIVKEASKPLKDVYVSTTFKNFMINLPAASAAGPLIKTFAPARSAKKFVLKGSDFAEELLLAVEPSSLPARLGGQLDDGVQWARRKS